MNLHIPHDFRKTIGKPVSRHRFSATTSSIVVITHKSDYIIQKFFIRKIEMSQINELKHLNMTVMGGGKDDLKKIKNMGHQKPYCIIHINKTKG